MIAATQDGLDAEQRSTLEQLMIHARLLLETDLAAQAEGRFGIHLDGTIEDEDALPETTDKSTRRDLEQIVAHLRTLGEDAAGAVARLLREAAFTHLNRLVAIRIAEAIGLLPESLAKGLQSRGFKDLGEIMPILAGDYRAYLRLCGDELAADAPALFDPRNPLLALEPSTAALDELVRLISTPTTTEIWSAPDTLGWAYQLFNTGDERRAMREASAPRNSRELAVRNQFFTPRYVVDFLVQNTIGRRLVENNPTTPLLAELPLLVNPPTKPGPPLELPAVKCLDPACGSGHFLLGCYDILERAWQIAGVSPSESAPMIVASLWGVDIDLRCAQVASAAIVLRARRHCRDLELPRPNIVTARGLPGGSAALPTDLRLTAGQRRLIDRISKVLADAPLLGTLLKAEKALDAEIRHGVFGGKAGTLELTDEVADVTERDLLSHLQAIADQVSSSAVERLLAAEAHDALRLVQVVRQRYDAVLMNPPFGEPVPETKTYLQKAYGWMPRRTCDLLAAFVGRGIELCRPDGYLGAITARGAMFLSTFEMWRRDVLLGNRLVALVDLGYGVMEQAMVEAAAYVVGPGPPPADHEAVFVRLLKDSNRAQAIGCVIRADRDRHDESRVFRIKPREFDLVPGVPLAYWMSPSVRRLFPELPTIEGHGAEVRQGLATADDFRFVRAFWEVAPTTIGRSRQETLEGQRWVPFAKGGDYSPYWSDVHLVVDWENDGQRIKSHVDQQYPYLNGKIEWVVKNQEHYFRPGLTWPLRTNSGFGIRILPAGCIFSHKGPALIADDTETGLVLLGWLRTRIVQALLDSLVAAGDETTSGGASRSYEVGLVQRLPSPLGALNASQRAVVYELTQQIAEGRAAKDATEETTRRFVAPDLPRDGTPLPDLVTESSTFHFQQVVQAIASAAAVEGVFTTVTNLGTDAAAYLADEVGPHPDSYPRDVIQDEALFGRHFVDSMERLIGEVLTEHGGSRAVANLTFIADRRLEVLTHAFGRHPAVLEALRERLGLLPPEQPKGLITDIFSYLVGVTLGRWDVRIGQDPLRAPPTLGLFEPVPVCSPGMLVGLDGLPAREAPPGYPLQLPPGRLLVDEPGHPWDCEAAILRSAGALFDDPVGLIDHLLKVQGRTTLRDHLRKQFFKDHLSRYSKSRRKAPIYWPLTVPSKNWGVWIYAPTLARETLYAVASEAGRRERLAGEAVARLRREQQEGGAGRAVRSVVAELDAEETLADELRVFRSEAERVAGLGWEPDLDDGLALCAAPVADLFPTWPEAKKLRAELRKGKYEWAAVARWADRL